jgi:glycosyltransferase involved in cell wall biosynthesis
MKKVFLHLSNTDIRFDARILKELSALEQFACYERLAIGITDNKGSWVESKQVTAKITGVSLFTDLLNWMPRVPRYLFKLIELTCIFTLRGLQSNPTIVHCHDTFVLPAGVILKFVTGCKLVYDAHELESNKSGQSFCLSRGTLLIERLCWGQIDLLISVSDSILNWYTVNIGAKERILVLNSPTARRKESFLGIRSSHGKYFHSIFGIPREKFIFLYVGIIGRGRGVELALEAFAAVTIDAHLVLIGDGPLKSKVLSYSNNHKNIHIHRPVPHDQLVEIASHADVGLCLIENVSMSDYYCLPNKLFEYCFAGLQVLGSNLPEIKKVIREYSLGTYCSLDVASIRAAVMRLTNIKPDRSAIDVSALSWDVQADRLNGAYRRLLAQIG